MEDKSNIPVIILCGGKGTRLREETETIPKPMVSIGGKPILWHIMKIYSHHGFNKFILLLGYKGEAIKSFFLNYPWVSKDFNLKVKDRQIKPINGVNVEDWDITFIDTGSDSLTERRLYLAKEHLRNYDTFMLTYGDGVADVNITELLEFHKLKGDFLTITGVKSVSKHGKIAYENGKIMSFTEKPVLNDLVNGGFMVFDKGALDYISDRNVMMELDLIPKLVVQRKASIFHHTGFWHAMDTFQDKETLEALWANNSPWKIWS